MTSTVATSAPGFWVVEHYKPITANKWLTTTNPKNHDPTIVPVISPCRDCKPLALFDLAPTPGITYDLDPRLPSLSFPCVPPKCKTPPVNIGKPEQPDRRLEPRSATGETTTEATSTTTAPNCAGWYIAAPAWDLSAPNKVIGSIFTSMSTPPTSTTSSSTSKGPESSADVDDCDEGSTPNPTEKASPATQTVP